MIPLTTDQTRPTEPLRAGRRTVVAAAGLTGAALAAPLALRSLPDLFSGAAAAPRHLDRDSFAPHVGATFRASSGPDGPVDLTLVAIVDDPLTPGDPDSFALDFTTAGEMTQGTYELERAGFAAAPVFLVPGPSERRRGSLTAVFNRTDGSL